MSATERKFYIATLHNVYNSTSIVMHGRS